MNFRLLFEEYPGCPQLAVLDGGSYNCFTNLNNLEAYPAHLLLGSEIFDCVAMIGTSHEISQVESAWREALRVLRRGGHLLLLDLGRYRGLLGRVKDFFSGQGVDKVKAQRYHRYGLHGFLHHYKKSDFRLLPVQVERR